MVLHHVDRLHHYERLFLYHTNGVAQMIVKTKRPQTQELKTKPSDAKTSRLLEKLAAKYKGLFEQSTNCEAEFLAAEKQLKEAQTKNLGLGARVRWTAGGQAR